MATTISTQDLENARRDIDDIGKAVNENVIVDPRYGEDFKSLPMIASEAQGKIDEWQDAINTIVVNDGVPALAVSDASGKTQQEINSSLIGLASAPELINSKIRVIAGAIRNTGSGWAWISDPNHTPVGVTPTITATATTLTINYGFTAKRVLSLVATPDETLAGLGFTIGGSVGFSATVLQIKAPLNFIVNTSTGVITAPPYLINGMSATIGGGVCTITHQEVFAAGDAPVAEGLGTTSANSGVLLSYNANTSTLNGGGNLDGVIAYSGSAWTYAGQLKTAPTFNWVASGADAYLEVTHSTTDVYNISITPRDTPVQTRVATVNATMFRVRFYDAAGTLLLTPQTTMQFYFSRAAKLPKNSLYGTFAVKRGHVSVSPADLISTSGNFWILGVMEVL